MPAGVRPEAYWEGLPLGETGRYVTDLLVDPAHAFVVSLRLPSNGTLFGPYAERDDSVCAPGVLSDRSRQSARRLPRCRPATSCRGCSAAPSRRCSRRTVSATPCCSSRTVSSGSPSGEYVEAAKLFASHGYVVIAPFHGDLRYADIDLDSFAALYALLKYRTFVAMQAARPLSLSLALDAVLGHPDFRDHVDPDRIGGFGASMGGEALLLLGGAALSTGPTLSAERVTLDARLKAAVGLVPYFGIDVYPAFGRDLAGLDGFIAALSRALRHGGPDGADRHRRARHAAHVRHAPAGGADRPAARLRRGALRGRHLHVGARVSSPGSSEAATSRARRAPA